MTTTKARELADWLQRAAQAVEYGTVDVTLKIVAGEVRRIERTTKESEQPDSSLETRGQSDGTGER